MDFFSTEASTKFSHRFEWARSCKRLVTGVRTCLKVQDTRNQPPPKPEKIQNYNLCFFAGCSHTSPCITVDKSRKRWHTCHLFYWNIVEKEWKIGMFRSRTWKRRMCKRGGSPSSCGSYLPRSHSEVKCIDKSEDETPGLLYTDANKAEKSLLYRLGMDCRQENRSPASVP